jgi:crotonobetainyl-CoA:carnitine CoA-transferase CaiB-like acyl-CoA transferase
MSSYHAAINRGKRSISLDLKNPAGLDVALRLIANADVVVENFAPGALKRNGIDLEALRAQHPRLITVSISLYGAAAASGALAKRGGLAIVAEGESSITAMIRDKEGTPVMGNVPFGDLVAGFSAYGGITTALFDRERTGQGRHLDISMVRALFAFNSVHVTGYQIPARDGFNRRPAGYGIFPTTDGYVTLGVNNDSLFHRLAAAMDRPDMIDDPRYGSYRERDARGDEVDAIVAEWTSQLTADEVIARVSTTGVPCGKVRLPGEMLEDPEIRALGFVETVDDNLGGTIDTPANPMGFHREGSGIPLLNQHARELLAEIGVDDAEFESLVARHAFDKS